jgi:hypothetical protein
VTLQNPAKLPVNWCRWKPGKSISLASAAMSNCASTRVIFGTCSASNLLREYRKIKRPFPPTTAPPRAGAGSHTPRCPPWRTPCQGGPKALRASGRPALDVGDVLYCLQKWRWDERPFCGKVRVLVHHFAPRRRNAPHGEEETLWRPIRPIGHTHLSLGSYPHTGRRAWRVSNT